MEQRVIVGLEQGADWPRLKRDLLSAGARHTSDPVSYQPDAVVATLAATQDVATFIEQAKKLAGVRYVEPDAMSGTF